eukprot:gene25540-11276_t
MAKQTGVVTKWLASRGFGFIKTEGCEEELFVHHSA